MENTIHLQAYGYQAEICSQRGANLIDLSKGTMKSVRTPKQFDDFTAEPFFWGCPILFPPNRISGASFRFENRRYAFPVDEPHLGTFLHGRLHEQPFVCAFHTETEAVFFYQATNTKPYLSFPHAFTLTVRYVLQADGMHQQVTLKNDSSQNMPYALGFHTTFAVPFTADGQKHDIRLGLDVGREIVRDENHLPTGEIIDDSPLRQALLNDQINPCEHSFSHHFEMSGRHEMRLTDIGTKCWIHYRASDEYHYWMLYKGEGTDYLCVEPQTWMINSPNAPFHREETGFTALRPLEERTMETVLSLEESNP